LTPLAGMQLESLSLRKIHGVDLHAVAQFPLKKLFLGTASGNLDLTALKGLKLEELDLEGRPVSDLSPLQGMPLRELFLNGTKVTDLGPLRGMPLKRLECSGAPITDLSPLAQCTALEVLAINRTRVEDLRALAGLKLVALRIDDTQVRDVSALRGMSLRRLIAHNCAVTDVAPLQECRQLERLTLPRSARNVGSLRELPALAEVSFRWDVSRDGPAQSAAAFWQEFDSGAVHLSDEMLTGLEGALRAAGVDARPQQNEDGTISLWLDGKPVKDLGFLAGFPISVLTLRSTRVTDLKPLRGMMLKRLVIDGTQVADLSPLAGMPLESLSIAGTPVSDLSPLAEVPLKSLFMAACPNLSDLQALHGITTLESIVLPPGARGFDFLRASTNLREISFVVDHSGFHAAQSAEDFWAQEARAPGQNQRRAAEVSPKTSAPSPGAPGPK
jgi:Leucine-rich repeat (LRR) protein